MPPQPVMIPNPGGMRAVPAPTAEQVHFNEVADLVHGAMDIINPDNNFLEKLMQNLAGDVDLAVGDFVAGSAEGVADRYLSVFIARHWAGMVQHGTVSVDMHAMLRLMERYGHHFGKMDDLIGPTKVEILNRAAKSFAHFSAGAASGVVLKVVKQGGNILTVYGFVRDVQSGSPVDTAAVGALVGALVGQGVALLFGPPGWAAIAVSAVASFVFGAAAKTVYQEWGPDHRPVIVNDRWYEGAKEPR